MEWMHAAGPESVTKMARCLDCSWVSMIAHFDDAAPRHHIGQTGHGVVMEIRRNQNLYPVNTEPPAGDR